jgi:hypothetical protein
MQNVKRTAILTASLLICSTNALADEVVIKYHSGKVQQVTLQEPTDQIQEISYRKTAQGPTQSADQPRVVPAPALPLPQPPPAPTGDKTSPKPPADTGASGEKLPFKIKWAPPKENW